MRLSLPKNIQLIKNKKFLVQGVNMATDIEFIAVSDPKTRDALIQASTRVAAAREVRGHGSLVFNSSKAGAM